MTGQHDEDETAAFASPPCYGHEVDPAYMGASGGAPRESNDMTALNTDDLIEHILTRFHETHRRELPQLIELAEKVEAVHGNHPQAPHGLADLLHLMSGELEDHMEKEELILFPVMRGGTCSGLDAPITQMRHDHDAHGEHLQELGRLTHDFTPPQDSCRTWQALCTGTAKLVADLKEHINLENNVLFPRFQGASDR